MSEADAAFLKLAEERARAFLAAEPLPAPEPGHFAMVVGPTIAESLRAAMLSVGLVAVDDGEVSLVLCPLETLLADLRSRGGSCNVAATALRASNAPGCLPLLIMTSDGRYLVRRAPRLLLSPGGAA